MAATHWSTRMTVEEINDYFASVGERVSSQIDHTPFRTLDEKVNDTEMSYFNQLTVSRFLEIVLELKISKSSGIPDLNSHLVIHAMKIIPEVFEHICNESLSEGIFPQD